MALSHSLSASAQSLATSTRRDVDCSPITCDPATMGNVARIFVDFLSEHASEAYKVYCANVEIMQRDLDEVERLLQSTWCKYYDKGIEIMAAQHFSRSSRQINRRRALTLKSLLLKPVQRMPRYTLIFQEMARATPVYDAPRAYAVLERAALMLQNECRGINQAKSAPKSRRAAKITWLVGQRLRFADQVPRTFFLQLLGEVLLCGCLYFAYRGKHRMKGHFASAILFETMFILARVDLEDGRLRIEICIDLSKMLIEACDNGKGLQCYTAPHSWKLAFDLNGDMYEIILAACSAKEFQVWHRSLSTRIVHQGRPDTAQRLPLASPLKTRMRSVGKSYGSVSSFVRRMPIERSTSVGQISGRYQISIKNTWNREVGDSASTPTLRILRSQSVANPGHIEMLAPLRDDRRAIEAALFDVWTKSTLPYPGMKSSRTDRIRAPTIQVARKFSMSSITSNFSASKCSGSYSSVTSSKKHGSLSVREEVTVASKICKNPPHTRNLQTMDLLPADFDLQVYPARQRTASKLRASTMFIEHPLRHERTRPGWGITLRRTESMRTPQTSMFSNGHEVGMAGPTTLETEKTLKKKGKTKLFSLFH
ncbi:hypothetical protein K431DRAFT_312600 [Polychaeton citri CBS 116435]|uniref:DH domain-containing protein n=1 Tax=Polychaeton citri CBS 116435 TaxID=1314669 RepID=A0A9P4QAN4_9PEZI|nr:hypothetical protein K431DRAFT_312600 [Polychaeton citri CBS 116435]